MVFFYFCYTFPFFRFFRFPIFIFPFDLGIFPVQTGFFLVVVSAHFVPIPPFPILLMNSFANFSEKQLPAKEDFYSKLNDCGVPEEDYNYAKMIWEKFNLKNLGEYHDLYLKSDVLLLADVFEEFRNICSEIILWIQLGIIPLLDYPGMLC